MGKIGRSANRSPQSLVTSHRLLDAHTKIIEKNNVVRADYLPGRKVLRLSQSAP
jgi:hypothetical protein